MRQVPGFGLGYGRYNDVIPASLYRESSAVVLGHFPLTPALSHQEGEGENGRREQIARLRGIEEPR